MRELAKLMNLHGRIPRLTGYEMCDSINDLMKDLLLTGTRENPGRYFEHIRRALSREYPSEALQSVESYLSRGEDQLSTVADACSTLQLKDALNRLDGHSFHALASAHARIHKISVRDMLRVPLDKFADNLVSWPTADCSVLTLRRLHEFSAEQDQVTGRITCRSQSIAAHYLKRVQRVVSGIRIACVHLGFIESTADLSAAILDKVCLHLSATLLLPPNEVMEWPLTELVQKLRTTQGDHVPPHSASSRGGSAIIPRERIDGSPKFLEAGNVTHRGGEAEAFPSESAARSRGGGDGDDQLKARLLNVYMRGLAGSRLAAAEAILRNDGLTVNDKLTRIEEFLPIPPTASAQQLADLFGKSKAAVINTDWWKRNRKGQKAMQIGRRREKHRERAGQYQPDRASDENDCR